MGPKQIDLVEHIYESPLGSVPVGIIEFDDGCKAISAMGLADMLGRHVSMSNADGCRNAYCVRTSQGRPTRKLQRVLGLDGVITVMAASMGRIGAEESQSIVSWLQQKGVSPKLWPDEEAPVPMRPSPSRVAIRRNEKLASSLDRLVLAGDGKQGGQSGTPFDSIRETDEHGREFWSARLLQGPLGYIEFRNFHDAIERAKISCEMAGQPVFEHFTASAKTIVVGNGASREVDDVRLSRYACYLVAMNGDPRKPEIAAAQQYFVIRTRQAETQAEGLNNDNIARMLLLMQDQIKTTQAHAVALVDHERRIVDAADKAERALAEIQRLQETRPAFEGIHTIQEWARHLGVPLQSARKIKDRQELGQFLTAICEDRGVNFVRGYRVTELGHSVNGYPVEVLREFKAHFVDFEGTRPERAVVIPRLKKLIGDQKPTAFDFTRRSN